MGLNDSARGHSTESNVGALEEITNGYSLPSSYVHMYIRAHTHVRTHRHMQKEIYLLYSALNVFFQSHSFLSLIFNIKLNYPATWYFLV